MSQHSILFGTIWLGGAPGELNLVRESLEFNIRAISTIPEACFWCPEDFRPAQSEDLRTLQMIAVSKWTTLRDHESILVDFLAVLARMHWSDAHLVNQSGDRTLAGGPFRYEYEFEFEGWSVRRIEPAGDRIRLTRAVSPDSPFGCAPPTPRPLERSCRVSMVSGWRGGVGGCDGLCSRSPP